ncbi:uncharacterized protein LOC124679315 isoform X1 [Lolium rigidum]|uniref:uncharacterized protein LOC124679315 isoform X1 n=1 Tax=Lolium rigidum TaxID=89674 RepID=UPI001F5DD89A|nr:uncharacterized protein LOC124679315 isoform X1 [Lolium rigidum]
MREVTPRKAPPTPKVEPHCCKTVPSTMTDSTMPLLDKMKDLIDRRKSLQAMRKNIDEHMEKLRKLNHDGTVARVLLSKRLDDIRELIAKLKNMRADYEKTRNMQDFLAKLLDMKEDLTKAENMAVDINKDCAILEANTRLGGELVEMLRKEVDVYEIAFRQFLELGRSTMEQVEEVKKVVKVGAAVCLVGGLGGLLLILAKI